MSAIFNPFSRIAGLKSLVWGLFFIISLTLLFAVSGIVQDGFLHFTLLDVASWRVLTMNVVAWILFALPLYVGGVLLSHSKVRPVDVFGTLAFTQLLLIPMNLLLYVPSWRDSLNHVVANMLSGAMPQGGAMALVMAMGVWAIVWLVMFVVWGYNAFTTSCNVRGAKAVAIYIVAWVVATLVVPIFARWICL
jgi:hypothetical protein